MLSKPCLNLCNLEELPELGAPSIPSVSIKPGTIPAHDDSELLNPVEGRRRIVIVTNHLPVVSLWDDATQRWQFELDEDAISLQIQAGLSPDDDVIYVGSLKVQVDSNDREEVTAFLIEKYRCLPVFLPEDVQETYYHGFCKHYLWPLLHCKLPMPTRLNMGSGHHHLVVWQAYVSANIAFANKVVELISYKLSEGGEAFVWVHDYHLMLVPTMLRRQCFRINVGFFLHSPFPSSEFFRVVPGREEILRGLLNSDVVGFQSFDYARHFLSCCSRLLGLDYKSTGGSLGVDYYGRIVRVKVLPVGVHMGRLQTLMSKPETASRIQELKEKFKGKRVIVGVDDMDVLKGISLKFLAFKELLDNQPLYRGDLVLVQIANPARSKGEDVQQEEEEIVKIADGVNEKYGQPGYDPIVFIYGPVSTLEKAAYYAIAECCLLNAVKDGLNLMPYKYTICRQGSPELDLALGIKENKRSMIIVSEFVGCSPSLGGAIRVNPWDVEEISEAIHQAMSMDEREKETRHQQHLKYIISHDIAIWARSFNEDLVRACGDSSQKRLWGVGFGLSFRLVALPGHFKKLSVDNIQKAYDSTNNRLILLDYDGTMTPKSSMNNPPSDEVIELLQALCIDPKNTVFIVSGRSREDLSKMFSPCEKLGISAEHGCFTRWSRDSAWESITFTEDFEWKSAVQLIMEHYTEATDGSFIEEKETAIVWHYLDADRVFGSWQAKELLDHLENVLINEPIMVKRGKFKIEVKPLGVSKGTAVASLMARMKERGKTPDFVLCMGDDRSDENMFEIIDQATKDPAVLPPISKVFPCTVGQKPSMATYYLNDTHEVKEMLLDLLGVEEKPAELDEAQSFD